MDPVVRFTKEIRKNRKLCDFLIENEALNNFMKNSINYIKKWKLTDKNVICMTRRTTNPIVRAFNWSGTPEGQEYWESLSDKYKEKRL